jgi:hypothetical protein
LSDTADAASQTRDWLATRSASRHLAALQRHQRAEIVAAQAQMYSRLGLDMHLALINGAAGLVSFRDGKPFSVGGFTVRGYRIVEMDFLADPERLGRLDLTILGD